jgi:oxygen-independent coproporphyrinogen III oxidase
MRPTLAQRMTHGGYDGYAYAYPHKTCYRPLDPPISLHEVWETEAKENLFLYVHFPFCEMRCGFCNLFTTVRPGASFVDQTLTSIRFQAEQAAGAIRNHRIAQAAFGGGTPSFLNEHQIEEAFGFLERIWSVQWRKIPVSFEVSPGTVSGSKLVLLKNLGVDRISMGVQSFVVEDLLALKRPQPQKELFQACDFIKSTRFKVFNIDLIYGNEGQDAERWLTSVKRALAWQPEELYLYPLYIRKLTNLDRIGKRPAEHRRELYRLARDLLLESGYRQISMRLFRHHDVTRHSQFCCQDDGMVGLGPGARSYTRSLHYSSEYAVAQTGVRKIIEQFNSRPGKLHGFADYGVELDSSEQRIRHLIKSLLRCEGVCKTEYQNKFGTALYDDHPQLEELMELGLAIDDRDVLRLTDEGLAWSDTVGPWLYSDTMTARMQAFEVK